MRLEELRHEVREGRARASAEVVWEDAGRAPQTLFFETPERFANDLAPSVDAFVLAALPAAVWCGERRLRVAGALCPQLASGLGRAVATWCEWYAHCRRVALETDGAGPAPPAREPHGAAFFSGGLDSFALLRGNLEQHPEGHPDRIRDLIVLFGSNGFEFEAGRPVPGRLADYEALLSRLAPLARREGRALVPVHFNARWLLPDYRAWAFLAFGPMICSVAHALSSRHTRVLLASSGAGVGDPRHGSHPDLDPLYSSGAVAIRVGDPGVTRFEKTRRIVDWEPATRNLQPCWQRSRRLADGRLNCGRCEKCLRTMLALVALDALHAFPAFVENDVRPKWVERVVMPHRVKVELLEQLEAPLARVGRHDLVRAIRRRARRFRREEALCQARDRLTRLASTPRRDRGPRG
jgi:hypothetical protein